MIDVKKAPFNLSEEQEKWVYEKLNSLTDKEKAGQLFCVLGTIFDKETLYKLTHEYCIGGILFRPEPCVVINQKYAEAESGIKVPLLKAANLEEGGIGAISDGTFYGTQMQVAATDNTAYAKTFGKFCAEEGRSCGVNWTFSPVCDIDYNFRNPITNVRTFGSYPARVKKMTKAYVDTVQKYGLAACAKHFPGDGVDFRDQHLHPTINSLSAKKWYVTYGAIYKNLIDGGLLSIMVGHIKQPAVEQDICPTLEYKDCLPASLSKHLITGVLREKYGFNGVITTDATIMGGYTMPMERRFALPATINAGIDMIVFNTDFEEDYSIILNAINSGEICRERLDDAVTRILALKAKVCFDKTSVVLTGKQRKVEEFADNSVTLVKNIGNILPVTSDRYPEIRLILLGKDALGDGNSAVAVATKELERRGFKVTLYSRESDDMHGVKELSNQRLTLYIANEPTESNRTTVRLSWNPKHAMDAPRYVREEPSVFLSVYNPYHLQDVPAVKVYVNAYSPTSINIKAAIAKLAGESPFKGTSPVDAFCGLKDTRY